MFKKMLLKLVSLLSELIMHTVKSVISLLLFFFMLSMFIYNLDIQHYTWHTDKDGYKRMVIHDQVAVIQALEPTELINSYFNEK